MRREIDVRICVSDVPVAQRVTVRTDRGVERQAGVGGGNLVSRGRRPQASIPRYPASFAGTANLDW
jgi:hypothetical protein